MTGEPRTSEAIGRPHRPAAPARATSRAGWARCAAATVLALLLLVCAASVRAAPVTAEVTGTTANGFARLVFTFTEEVEADVRASNGVVIVGFKRPVDLSVDYLPLAAAGYIAVARADPDGTAVRLALMRKVTVNAMAAGERLYIDLLPESWTGLPPGLPQEVVEELARRAREAEKKLKARERVVRRQFAPIRLRVAVLPTFTRYTFDLPEQIGVTSDRGNDKLALRFDAPLKFDLADAKAALPPTIAAIDAEPDDVSAAVRFSFVGKVDVRTFREDDAFVVDVSAAGARERVAAEAEAVARPSSLEPGAKSQAKADPQKRSPTTPVPEAAPPIPPALSYEMSPSRERQSSAHGGPEPMQVARAAEVPQGAAPSADARSGSGTDAPVIASATRQGDTVRVTFPFRAPTSAAVFRRADMLWLVFDSAVPVEIARLKADAGQIVRSADMFRSGQGQVVRLKLARPRLSSLAADGDAWVVTLGDVTLEPTAPLPIARTQAAPSPTSAVIGLEDARHIHHLVDPELGDRLLVVTAFGPARGVLKAQEFVEFRALVSTHGLVIQPLADDVSAERLPDKVLITRPGGLTLTDWSSAASAGAAAYRSGPLDPQIWSVDRQANFLERRAALMQEAAEAPEGARGPARLNVARFYVAREMYPEAKAVLDVAVVTERERPDLATGLVLRAIANILMGRCDAGLKDLSNAAVANHHDAPVWRALAHAGQHRWAEAHEGLSNVEAATADLPLELQRLALKEAVRSAIEVGDLSAAAHRLNEFDGLGVPRELKPQLALLAGRLAEKLGRPGDALVAYLAAAESIDEPIAAQGKLRDVVLRHALKELSRNDATTELEKLAARWRGDDTENETLHLLERFYAEEGRYREAFHAMQVAVTAHSRSELTRKTQDEAAATFESLFLGDRAEALSPVEALGLFYDFRALTPIGRRGDEMIRRLAERLIAMDLLAQAAELLQHQVDHRLQGAARTQVAIRLATIYLMNRKPDRALQLLRTSRASDLPTEQRNQRLLIEARALSDTGRHDLALEVVANLDGREAERLRADIYWAARRWRQTAEQIERLHGERWRDFAPLSETERADVLRAAIAYALADDMLGLERFRQRYAPKMSDGPDRRMFEVVTAPFSAKSGEFADIARAASSVDTLDAFLRDLRARYPEPGGAQSSVPPPRRG